MVGRKLLVQAMVLAIVVGLMAFMLQPLYALTRNLSALTPPTVTPVSLLPTPLPTPGPTPTAVPRPLQGQIVFGTSVYDSTSGLYMRQQVFSYHFPSTIAWMAYLERPVLNASLVIRIVRLRPSPAIVWQSTDRVPAQEIRVMPFVISPDEWQSYSLTHAGYYGVVYTLGRRQVSSGVFKLLEPVRTVRVHSRCRAGHKCSMTRAAGRTPKRVSRTRPHPSSSPGPYTVPAAGRAERAP